jgi:hypothetical protein
MLFLTLERIEFVHTDAGLVAEQQHQNSEPYGGLGGCHRQDEKHEYLTVHVIQVMGKRYEIRIHCKQHELDRHQQHDQVASVQKDTYDRQGKQNGA